VSELSTDDVSMRTTLLLEGLSISSNKSLAYTASFNINVVVVVVDFTGIVSTYDAGISGAYVIGTEGGKLLIFCFWFFFLHYHHR